MSSMQTAKSMLVCNYRNIIIIVYLLNELNADSQVHAEVNGIPGYAFFFVFLLFQDKHGVVEKLLQFLIGEVDAQLLQGVEL